MNNLSQSELAQKLLASVESSQGIHKLLNLMKALRDPEGGCPWDLQQNYQTILPFTIEEVYEVADAIEKQDYSSLKDELGDLLFQVVFYAQMANEEERFDFNDIVENICEKLVRRHPHVFGDADYQDEKQLNLAWEAQKHQERELKNSEQQGHNKVHTSLLDDIPKSLPELKKAHKIQKRVAKVGFDWPEVETVWDKIEEECLEVRQAVKSGDKQHVEEELGDLMFAVVNLTRHYGMDADMVLRKANQKFEKRFRQVEALANNNLDAYTLDEMEDFWEKAKQQCKTD